MKENLRDKILAWLVDEDYEVKSETLPAEAPIEWALGVTVKAPIQVKLIVQQAKTKKDRIAVTLGVLVSPVHREALEERGPSETLRIMSRVIEAIIHACPDCLVLVQPSPAQPQNIVITRILYEEEVNRASLTRTIRVLVNAYLLIITVMNGELGIIPQRRRDTGTTPSFM